MNHQFTLEITDREGWQKVFQVDKAIVYIGSDPGDDVSLDRIRGSGVAPRHVQLIAPSGGSGQYRLVNLGDGEIALGPVGAPGERPVAPRSFAVIGDGDTLHLGDFRLVFREGERTLALGAGAPSTALAVSQAGITAPALESAYGAIGLRLSLPMLDRCQQRHVRAS